MLKALYFPHTDITNEVVLKNALLLWDSIETIVPSVRWNPRRMVTNRAFNDAVDLIVQHRVPTQAEQQLAHESVMNLFRSGYISSLMRDMRPGFHRNNYLIYPEKFLPRTWELLTDRGIAHWDRHAGDYGVPSLIGYIMMSLLADACAGTQIQKITDRVDAYSWIAQNHAQVLGSQYVTGFDPSQVAPAFDRLVTLSLDALNARDIPLSKLVEMRQRELRSGGQHYSALRRRYLTALEAHITRVSKDAKSAADFRELQRVFKEEIKQDLADLKSELRLAAKKALISKDVLFGAVIAGGSLAFPTLAALAPGLDALGVIPLAKAAIEYRGARREILRKHTTSSLYLTSRRRLHAL
jgi:hypothetical protein